MGKHALPQPLGASPAHTVTAAWGWLRLLARRAERECAAICLASEGNQSSLFSFPGVATALLTHSPLSVGPGRSQQA